MPLKVVASAPGSLMLLGEYAVLHGKPALVCAVDQRVTVTLTPSSDRQINIHSDLHGHYATSLDSLEVEKPFQFILQTLLHCRARLREGMNLHIASQMSDQVGFGSSAAVTVATLAAIYASINLPVSPLELVRQGRQIIQTVQGRGSGADVAASVYGGMVNYLALPVSVEKMAVTHPLTVIYSGYKTPTAEMIQQVQTRFAAYPSLFRQLCNSIGQCAIDGVNAVRQENWQALGDIMTVQQGLMSSLGVNSVALQQIVTSLCAHTAIVGAKISGSGLGDCIVGLGEITTPFNSTAEGVMQIPVAMTLQGVTCEKN